MVSYIGLSVDGDSGTQDPFRTNSDYSSECRNQVRGLVKSYTERLGGKEAKEPDTGLEQEMDSLFVKPAATRSSCHDP